jgi:hypothetical protein
MSDTVIALGLIVIALILVMIWRQGPAAAPTTVIVRERPGWGWRRHWRRW